MSEITVMRQRTYTNGITNGVVTNGHTASPPPQLPHTKLPTYSNFLYTHRIKNDVTANGVVTTAPAKIVTNTRIDNVMDGTGTKIQHYKGKYEIPTGEYPTFLNIYYEYVLMNKNEEYMTEIQLKNGKGPLLIDLDFRFNYDTQQRQFNKSHIESLLLTYLDTIKTIHQFSLDEPIEIFVMTKPNINHVIKGDVRFVKDGIHIIVGLQMDHTAQQYLRKRIIERLNNNPSLWGGDEGATTPPIGFINNLEDIFDEKISRGDAPWQLYGSQKAVKPEYSHNEIYQLCYIYKWEFVYSDETESYTMEQTEIPVANYDLHKNFHKLSARYENHPAFVSTDLYETILAERPPSPPTAAATAAAITTQLGPNTAPNQTNPLLRIGTDDDTQGVVEGELSIQDVLQLKSTDELNYYIVTTYLPNPKITDEIKEIIEYTLILPAFYWGIGSYEKWIRVGWALYNLNNIMFAIWVKFSSQWNGFCWNDVFNLYDTWTHFNPNGLSKRSIIYWAKKECFPEFVEIKRKYCVGYVDIILSKFLIVSDEDYAQMLFNMAKDRYVCSHMKMNEWYEFREHRWVSIESGYSIQSNITEEMRNLFEDKYKIIIKQKLQVLKKAKEEDKSADEIKDIEKGFNGRIKNLESIITKLGKRTGIKDIMELVKVKFYDKDFFANLDTKRDLLCFKNGIVDLKQKLFREGYPHDYISKCTNNTYIPFDELLPEKVNEINKFMAELFPDQELRDYMWEHLASSLSGYPHTQTFNYYIGEGSNGKSLLTKLMKDSLGDYAGEPRINIILDDLPKNGTASPEYMDLKGIRYAVMVEPSKGKTLKEGIMKHLTSGVEGITARNLFEKQVTFILQLTLVICANIFLKIDSQDEGTWRRIRAIPFDSKFVDNPDPNNRYEFKKDEDKQQKMDGLKETFVSMLVHKYFETGGKVNDCKIVLDKSKEYRNNEDTVSQFIEENVEVYTPDDTQHKLQITDISTRLRIYLEINNAGGNRTRINIKEICKVLDKKFPRHIKFNNAAKSTRHWVGLSLTKLNNEDDEDA